MKPDVKLFLRVVLEFPQIVFGCIYYLWMCILNNVSIVKYDSLHETFIITMSNYRKPFSFGLLTFFPDYKQPIKIFKHEFGHSKQSQILKWFYIPFVMIPSTIWSGFYSWNTDHKFIKNLNYYWFYTEHWADNLGGIERDHGCTHKYPTK